MRSHDLLFIYSSACRISSLVAGQSRRFGKRFLLPILSILLLFCPNLAGVASAGVNTWTSNGPEGAAVAALAIDPSAPSTLYAGTYDGGVFKSTNGGGGWTAINVGLTSTEVWALAIDPASPSTLYVGTVGGGVFKSTNGGGSWAVVNTGLTEIRVTALTIDPSAPATLYAGTWGGGTVFKSTNGGGSWAAINTGLRETLVWSLAVDPSTPSTLYAGTYVGLFRSTNGGGSWSAINRAHVDSVFALAIDPSAPATLYSGWYDHGIFKSTNGGDGWATVNAGLTNTAVFALAIDPSNTATLYAGTEGGVFKSTNAGGNWIAINSGLTNTVVYAVAIDPSAPSTLYAGTDGGGVFKSTNGGGTWTAINTVLSPLGTTALLPTSAHSSGANGAFYTTNVSIANTGALAASFTLKFLGNNRDGSNGPEKSFGLEAGKSTTFLDVLGSVFGDTSSFGALRIVSNSSTLNVVSVTSTPGFGGTLGQTIPAVDVSDLIPAGSSRSILYIREGDGFRSNLVLASDASVATDVDVALVSPAGSTLATKSYSVPPNGMTQINRVVRDLGVSGPVTGARLVLSSATPGAAFTGFASVIDETTKDPTTLPVQPASVSGSAPYIWLLPASAHSRSINNVFYTTNVAIANVGAAPASFTLKFLGHNQDGLGGPEQTFNLESGKSVTYFDVLGTVFSQTSNFGAIRITSDSPALNIVSVTSTPGFGGTLSQTVPAVFSSDLIPAGSLRSILYIREGDGFRSNLILASNANVSTTVDAVLVSPEGVTLATKSYSVPPNGMTQIGRVVRDMGVSGAVTGARLVLSSSTLGAVFTGFVSVIDEITNDPTTVEAR